MITLMMEFGSETILMVISGNNIRFSNTTFGAIGCSIDGLQLNKSGAIKEFPDLELREDWRCESIKRFKERVNQMRTEEDVCDYLIEDLSKFGYVLKFKQKKGHRMEKLK